jgi:hypothetical protein
LTWPWPPFRDNAGKCIISAHANASGQVSWITRWKQWKKQWRNHSGYKDK